ncbi:MAG: methyl-accepting chemotaxis protein [Symploca sp. SIO1B1]|nr:methyl-accepting chemotaxis protein [Symploca sp. SIO1C2]NER96422.1 methyl-accepting chemotaxis protein [Symploca sp. SIO1B1]
MFKKITSRILFAYSIPLLFMIGLGVVVYSTTMKAFKLEKEIALAEQGIQEVDTVTYAISKMVLNTKAYIIFPKNQKYQNLYQEEYQNFQEKTTKLKPLITNPEERQLVDEIIAEGNKWHDVSQQVFKLVDAEDIPAASKQIQSLEIEKVDALREEMIERLESLLKEKLRTFEESQRFLVRLVVIGTILAAITTLIIGLLISWQLKNQMNRVIGAAENSSIQVTSSATEISASGKQLEATITQQVSSTNEVTATCQEIAANASELVQTMGRVANLAQTTAHAAGNSQQDLRRMEKTMHQLADATASISSKLGLISEKANNINSVVTTITKVADQTNLLSLNAAIEAEKAGEYGAGFAVVAREIRRLADQTAVATLEIEHMVKNMQSAVSSGVMEMDSFNKEVGHSVEDVQDIGEQIAQVIDQVQSLIPGFSNVSQSMEEQSQGAQQISEAMGQLSQSSRQTADALCETNTALEQLNDAAQGLQKEIYIFREQI